MSSSSTIFPSGIPIDLDFLNNITGGKLTVVEELLELFFVNAAECLSVLERSSRGEDNERWRKAASELKVLADNIGALELAKSCAIAQKALSASIEEKRKILVAVQVEVQKLRTYVRNNRL